MRKLALCALLAGGGCATVPVAGSHAPMHPVGQPVTFRAATDGPVDRIVLSYSRVTISLTTAGDVVHTPAEPETEVKTCTGAAVCAHTLAAPFPDGSLVTFRAVARRGSASGSEVYSFAAGAYPLPDEPVPIRLKGGTADRLDVVLVPQQGMDLGDFRLRLADVVDRSYFKYDPIRTFRGLYNFYYSMRFGRYQEACQFSDPSNMGTLSAVADAVVFLHADELTDCRSGKRISSELQNDKALIHETGHVLYGLHDEYCCSSNYAQQACVPQLWGTAAACQGDAGRIGHPPASCTQLSDGANTLPFWRIDPDGAAGCIMGQSQLNADSVFGKACLQRMDWRHRKCAGGECFPAQECP